MKSGWILTFTIMILLVASFVYSAEVKNERARQDGNRVVFEYDLEGDNEAEVSFALMIDGKKYQAKDLHLEGDYGKVRVGKGKIIYWNVLQDFPMGLHGNFEALIGTVGGAIKKEAGHKQVVEEWRPIQNTLTESYVQEKVKYYYDNKGEWAGIFVIDRIEKVRLEKKSDNEVVAHILYRYKPAPIQRRRDDRNGSDQRVFIFAKSYGKSSWEVVSMGGHWSGHP